MTRVEPIDPTDDALLQRHLDFEATHGIARFPKLPEFRAWLGDVNAVLLAAYDDQGELVGTAAASILPTISEDQVMLNMHAADGTFDVLIALAAAVEALPFAMDAKELLAHVSGPTPAQREDWVAAGFTFGGTRHRLTRELRAEDADLPSCDVPGIDVVPLASVPHLEAAALAVWNATHNDIPTSIEFGEIDASLWREELLIGPGDPFPPSLLVAVTADEEVAGVAVVLQRPGNPGVGSHRFTCTARAWRGRGVSLALKAALVRWAAASGLTSLVASNDDTNAAMLAINRRLGYTESHDIVLYRRPIAR